MRIGWEKAQEEEGDDDEDNHDHDYMMIFLCCRSIYRFETVIMKTTMEEN